MIKKFIKKNNPSIIKTKKKNKKKIKKIKKNVNFSSKIK